MPRFRFTAMTASGEEVVDVIEADDAKAAKKAFRGRGLFVTSLAELHDDGGSQSSEALRSGTRQSSEALRSGTRQSSEALRSGTRQSSEVLRSGTRQSSDVPERPSEVWRLPLQDAAGDESTDDPLADFGWVIEPGELGVCIRRSGFWYGSMAGCCTVLLFVPVAFFCWATSFGRAFEVSPSGSSGGQIFSLLINMMFYGVAGLLIVGGLLHVLRLAFVREAWHVASGRLLIRKSVLGISRDREYLNAEFVLEPHFDPHHREPHWRLALYHDGRKKFLITKPLSYLSQSTADSLTECRGLAEVLAKETGWIHRTADVGVEGQLASPSASDEHDLITALRSHGCRIGHDDLQRLTIALPQHGARVGGVVLIAAGGGWFWIMSAIIRSFVIDPEVSQHLIARIGIWLLMSPLMLAGLVFFVAGFSLLLGAEQWIVDRNQLLIRSKLFRWKAGTEFADAQLTLEPITTLDSDNRPHLTWQLQLRGPSGSRLRVLHQQQDDDVPRLLGELLSRRTGWPVEQREVSSR